MILLLLACVAGNTAPEDSGCETAVTWQNFAQGFFVSYCQSCHAATAADRHGAPEGIDFATEAEVRAQTDAVRRVVLTNATMPPGGGMLADDVTLLGEWLECSPTR
ncbi:MAG: hypothetical protein V4850_36130 [Myxococcota bacterium]